MQNAASFAPVALMATPLVAKILNIGIYVNIWEFWFKKEGIWGPVTLRLDPERNDGQKDASFATIELMATPFVAKILNIGIYVNLW